MRNKIDAQLKRLKQQGKKGLMTHVVVGYPSLKQTTALVEAMEQAGVDFVELQIPFSDPLADGPTIQQACERSLEQGTRVRDAFVVAAALSKKVQIPLLFMAYFNTVYKYGIQQFTQDAARAGISGLIVPDIPLEAAQHEHYLAACDENGLHNIVTLGPTTTKERLEQNAVIASGFVYCMSRSGVTGSQIGLSPDIQQYLSKVADKIKTPIAVGFGISSRQRLEAVLPYCDIAVVGSALLESISAGPPGEAPARAKAFLQELTGT